jgi:hypothetical protein
MVLAIYDFHSKEELTGGGGNQRQVRTKQRGGRNFDGRARGKQLSAVETVYPRRQFVVQPGADFFVTLAGSGTRKGVSLQDFFIGPAHAPQENTERRQGQVRVTIFSKTGLAK